MIVGNLPWLTFTISLLLTLSLRSPLAHAQASPTTEYQLKAASLFNFAKFVDWPVGAFSSNRAPINLCVFGDDPFGSALDKIIFEKRIDGREIVVFRKRRIGDLRACQIVFVSRSEDKVLAEILTGLKGALALVVGETADFAARGGEIQFYMDDNKVRFCVNMDAVQRARITISAKLLALATIVHDGNHSNGG